MGIGDNFGAAGGASQDGGRGRRGAGGRGGLPQGYVPRIQPGSGLGPQAQPNIDASDARDILVPPPAPFNPASWEDQVAVAKLGLQASMQSPRIRMLVQTLIDNMLRASYKPAVQPPWITKPYRAIDFGGATEMTIPGNSVWTTFTNLIFRMPDGYMGVVTEFAQGVTSPGDWANLTWSITVGGSPVPVWGNVTCQLSSFPYPRKTQILVPPGSIVALRALNSSVSSITNVGGFLLGWMWPVPSAGIDGTNAHGHGTVA